MSLTFFFDSLGYKTTRFCVGLHLFSNNTQKNISDSFPYLRGFIKFLCRRSVGFFMRAFLVFLLKESTERRRKQPGKLMAKSHSQPVNLPGAQPFMNPLYVLVYHFLFSPHFDVICDLLLSRPMAT